MLIYMSGPMTGRPDHGAAFFNEAAERIREQGDHLVINPAENFGGVVDPNRRPQYMRLDIHSLMTCDMVVLLPGWEDSEGAKLEVAIANELAIPTYKLEDFEAHAEEPPSRMEVNITAQELAYG